MDRVRITPDSREHWLSLRVEDITSTDVSALFGLSPYKTKFELWHEKKSQQAPEIEVSERMHMGNVLEAAIAKAAAEREGWDIRAKNHYIRLDGLRVGSSFDYERIGDETANIEVKNVDGLVFYQQWEKDDSGHIEAPAHIELQIQHQMLVSGREKSYLVALIGGNELIVRERLFDAHVGMAILKRCAEFWESVDAGNAPEPDYEKDAEFLTMLYNYAAPGKVVAADAAISALAHEYIDARDTKSGAEKRMKAIKAQVLEMIGDAEKVKGEGFSISAGLVAPTIVEAYERKGFRNFRLTVRKGKK
jgi:putative phage-type endonuclease